MAKSKPKSGDLLAIAINPDAPAAARKNGLLSATDVVHQSDAQFDAVLGVLTNRAEPVDIRLTALQTLQAASFVTTGTRRATPSSVAFCTTSSNFSPFSNATASVK